MGSDVLDLCGQRSYMEGGDCYGCGIFFFLHIKISKLKSEREKLLNDNNKNNSVREEDNSARGKVQSHSVRR